MPPRIGHNRGPRWDGVVEELKRRLTAVPFGETFLFSEHADLLGKEANSQDYGLRSALKALTREGIYFAAVPGIGYRRADDAAKSHLTTKGRRKSFRALGRASRVGSHVDDSKLERQARPGFWANLTVIHAAKKLLHGNAVNSQTKKYEKAPSMMEQERQRLAASLRQSEG